MNTKDFPIEAVIAKTMDALVGAGLSYQSVWGYYQRSYWKLKAFFATTACSITISIKLKYF